MSLEHSSVSVLMAGIAFLLFGLTVASESLQKIASNRIRLILNQLNENGLIGLLVGTLLTLLMQSSGAVTATMVNLGTARVISLPQVMGVIIGTAIGAALTVKLISLHFSEFGLLLFVVSFLMAFFIGKRKAKRFFEFTMGLGLLFFGLELIGKGATELMKLESLESSILFLRENWMFSFVLSIVMTSVFHSSTATLGVVMALVTSNVLSVPEALPWIYGANIGTASTGIMAALKGNFLGRQIAWANFAYRTASVLIFLPAAEYVIKFMTDQTTAGAAAIASIYLLLNVMGAAVFFPLRHFGVALIEKAIQPAESEKEFGVKYLKRSTYESFALGLAHAKREILEMGDIVLQMTELSIEIFHDDSPELIDRIRVLDDRVDLLLKEIKLFLIRVSEMAPEGINQSVIDVISVGSELEGAADLIDHHLVGLARKKRQGRLEFSREGWVGLRKLHKAAIRAVSLALTYFQTEDKTLAMQLVDLSTEVRIIEKSARELHITRLSRNDGENMGTSAIYLETINSYLQIVELLSRHAHRLVDASGEARAGRRPAANR